MSIRGCRAIAKSPGCATHQGKCNRPTDPGKRSCEFPGAWVSSVSPGDCVTQKGRKNTSGSSSRRSAGSSSISGRQLSSGVVVYVSSPRSQCEVFRIESAVCACSPVRSAVYVRSPIWTDVAAPHHSEEVQLQSTFDMIIIVAEPDCVPGIAASSPFFSPASAPVVLQLHPDSCLWGKK